MQGNKLCYLDTTKIETKIFKAKMKSYWLNSSSGLPYLTYQLP